MDEKNVYKLNLRLMNFLRDYEEKDFSFDDLSKVFSNTELMRLLQYRRGQNNLINILKRIDLSDEFQKLINENTRTLIQNNDYEEYMLLADDEIILDALHKGKVENPEDLLSVLSTDETKIRALNFRNVKKNISVVADVLSGIKDDSLKLEYINNLDIHNRKHLISMINITDENISRQLIEKYPNESGNLISKLENEEMRIYYYERYFRKLESRYKKIIFDSLSEENQIKYLNRYWKHLNDEERLSHLSVLKREDVILEKIGNISSDFEKIKLISKLGSNQKELIRKIESTISYHDGKQLIRKLKKAELEFAIADLNIDKLFAAIDDKEKVKFIKESFGLTSNVELLILSTIKDYKNIEDIINHQDYFPEYDSKYDKLIIRCAEQYKVNSDQLIKLVKLAGLEILKNIQNENIQKLVNLDEESFNKVIDLFDVEKHKMDESTLNDVINMYLQRSFKLSYPEIININAAIRLGIQDGDKEIVLSLMDKIVNEYDVSKILKKHNYTSEELLKELISSATPDVKAMNCLREITNGYIVYKRNEYVQSNISTLQEKFCAARVEPKYAQKFMIENYPISIIRQEVFNPNRITLKQGYSEREVEFVNHPTALETIIKFKRNPSQFNRIPEEAKKYMPIFEKLFQVPDLLLSSTPSESLRWIYEPVTYVSPEPIRDILIDLDVDALKTGILKDDSIYKLLSDTLSKYKVLGYTKEMCDTFCSVDLWTYGSTISSLMKNFPVIYDELKEKMEKGEIKNITLPALLDMAECFRMDSNKLALIFGKDNIRLISSNPGPNSSSESKEKRIAKAQEYLSVMHEREYVSVPSCDRDFELSSGKKMNVVIGNVSDPINLTYGERTGACMRIGGHANSLFDFCLNNEHGFHIRFSSSDDERFVSRVSGFRNGNTVFLNELRTSVDGRYTNEDVREACEMAARFLIEQSKDSPHPIENVVIAPEYVMKGEPTTQLNVSEIKKGVGIFYSDVNANNAVVIATSNSDDSLVPVKLGNGGMTKYPVQRGKIRMHVGETCIEHLNRIELIDQILSGKQIEDTTTTSKKDIAFCYCGEDWYVAVDSKGTVSEYIMKSSTKKGVANKEKEECLAMIKQNFGYSNDNPNTNGLGGTKR